MKFATFAIACLVLASPAFASRGLFNPGTSCNSFVAVKLTLKHGRCSGSASSSCRAVSTFENVVREALDAVVAVGVCDQASVAESATAIARAVASAYADAFTLMSCSENARGFGCAFGVSDGDSFARAYARAFASVLAAVFPPLETGVSALCLAEVESIGLGFAQASSGALSESCTVNAGTASTFVSQFTLASTTLITRAIARARARACKTSTTAETACKAFIEGSSKGVTRTVDNPFQTGGSTGGGSTSGSTTTSSTASKVKDCLSLVERQCCVNVNFLKKEFCPQHEIIKGNPAGTILRSKVANEECFCH